jgi:hypothetical protein
VCVRGDRWAICAVAHKPGGSEAAEGGVAKREAGDAVATRSGDVIVERQAGSGDETPRTLWRFTDASRVRGLLVLNAIGAMRHRDARSGRSGIWSQRRDPADAQQAATTSPPTRPSEKNDTRSCGLPALAGLVRLGGREVLQSGRPRSAEPPAVTYMSIDPRPPLSLRRREVSTPCGPTPCRPESSPAELCMTRRATGLRIIKPRRPPSEVNLLTPKPRAHAARSDHRSGKERITTCSGDDGPA